MSDNLKISDAISFELRIRPSTQEHAIFPWQAYLKATWPDDRYVEQVLDGLNPVDLLKSIAEGLRVVDEYQMGHELGEQLEAHTAHLITRDDPRQDYDDS